VPIRGIVLGASGFAFAVAVLILWLGSASSDTIKQLIAQGQVTQGELVSTSYGSSDEMLIDYTVNGTTYRLTAFSTPSNRSRPIFDPAPVDVPRLGPAEAWQVVYLPSDPETARLRVDLNPTNMITYIAAGFFALIGLVFGLFGWRVLGKLKGLGLADKA
jgi:Protein of unknown function (DUF3592)